MPRSFPLPPPRLLSVLVALACGAAQAQPQPQPALPSPGASAPERGVKLRSSRVLGPSTKSGSKPAMVLSADRLAAQVDQEARADGHTELRYGDLLIQADHLEYALPTDLARARGQVRISQNGNLFTGPELSLYVNRFEGEFLTPTFFLAATGGTGRAESIRFIDSGHLQAQSSSYTSCPRDEGRDPAWQITARTIHFDLEGNEGEAEGAVLRFLGVPLLGAPSLSFPIGSDRKSGLLPPNVFLDSRSGLEYGQPYYWNIAPQRDATFTPFLMTRRGPGLDSEFRYLEPEHKGRLNLALLPHDRVSGRTRWATLLRQDGRLQGWRYRLQAERVSDDDYWKDLTRRVESQTPRLLAADLQLARARELSWGQVETYARVQRWQALQGADPLSRFTTPYQRSPQLGIRLTTAADEAVLDSFRPWGRQAQLEGGIELEYNRFDLPATALADQRNAGGGQRAHLLGHVAAPVGGEAWWLIPRLSVNAASYALDQPDAQGRRHPGRVIPSFSVDHGWVLERETTLFGRDYRQTLEPRLLYVNTPFRAQANLPNFDAAPKDFNFDSIYTDNPFSGVDRVADLNALSVGATSRWVNTQQGEEVLRLGAVQRFLFRDQRITPEGQPVTQRFSDLLLAANAHLSPTWWADGAAEFNPQTHRSVRSVVRGRYNPGPFRTISLAYRYARGQSEQVELAWQWPLWGQASRAKGGGGGTSCGGAWYSAGRLQYSLQDRRLTDSVAGLEYDAGCWLLRMGVERLSTGRAETKTQFMLQLELVGLSSLGSNALKVLKDNVPGYRRLSADRSASSDFQP